MSFSKHPCKICINEVKDNDLAVLCDLCEKWVHTAFTGIEETQYENLREVPCYLKLLSVLHYRVSLLFSQ